MKNPTVRGLYISPIKSTAMQLYQSITLDEIGIVNDRRWMVVDNTGDFVSQRDYEKMALIETKIKGKDLLITAPGMDTLTMRVNEIGEVVKVKIRKHRGNAYDQGDEAAEWFSEFLGDPVRLVRLPELSTPGRFIQKVDKAYGPTIGADSGFTDGFPITILSTGSFIDLKQRLPAGVSQRIDIENFRANIIISASPYEEDKWKVIKIGNITLQVVKPCPRCVITRVDRKIGDLIHQPEPLRTLATYRKTKVNDKEVVIFAQNCVHFNRGSIEMGQTIEVLEYKA